MSKIIIKNAPKNPFKMAKLITEIAGREIDVPADGIVDAREVAKSQKQKKAKK
jgi:hypothetical protein